jgi:hypothetical protein
MEITLKLELNEVNAVLDMMGAQPTSTNVWPLAAKIRAQAEVQLPKHSEGAGDEGSTTD